MNSKNIENVKRKLSFDEDDTDAKRQRSESECSALPYDLENDPDANITNSSSQIIITSNNTFLGNTLHIDEDYHNEFNIQLSPWTSFMRDSLIGANKLHTSFNFELSPWNSFENSKSDERIKTPYFGSSDNDFSGFSTNLSSIFYYSPNHSSDKSDKTPLGEWTQIFTPDISNIEPFTTAGPSNKDAFGNVYNQLSTENIDDHQTSYLPNLQNNIIKKGLHNNNHYENNRNVSFIPFIIKPYDPSIFLENNSNFITSTPNKDFKGTFDWLQFHTNKTINISDNSTPNKTIIISDNSTPNNTINISDNPTQIKINFTDTASDNSISDNTNSYSYCDISDCNRSHCKLTDCNGSETNYSDTEIQASNFEIFPSEQNTIEISDDSLRCINGTIEFTPMRPIRLSHCCYKIEPKNLIETVNKTDSIPSTDCSTNTSYNNIDSRIRYSIVHELNLERCCSLENYLSDKYHFSDSQEHLILRPQSINSNNNMSAFDCSSDNSFDMSYHYINNSNRNVARVPLEDPQAPIRVPILIPNWLNRFTEAQRQLTTSREVIDSSYSSSSSEFATSSDFVRNHNSNRSVSLDFSEISSYIIDSCNTETWSILNLSLEIQNLNDGLYSLVDSLSGHHSLDASYDSC